MSPVVVALLLLLLSPVVESAVSAPSFKPSPELFEGWMAQGGHAVSAADSFPELRAKFFARVASWAAGILEEHSTMYSVLSFFGQTEGIDVSELARDLGRVGESASVAHFVERSQALIKKHQAALQAKPTAEFKPLGENPYPYWGFLPPYKGSAVPNASAAEWENECCKKNTAKAEWDGDHVVLTLEAKECGAVCSDNYLLGTVEGMHFVGMSWVSGKHELKWKVSGTAAEQYDMRTKGVRVFGFLHDMVQTVVDVLATVNLFLQPAIGKYPDHPSTSVSENNVYFMEHYTQLKPTMAPRGKVGSKNITGVDASLIQTGDFIGIIRLDGLDPMLAWAMGSTTGHTVVAIRNETTGELFIAESQVKQSYWPVNGVQRTPYATWIEQAAAAGYNAVWAPLSDESRRKLDVGKMWEFFAEVEGLDYGYHTLLWGWIDRERNNYPCLPPDFKACLRWEHVEVMFSWLEALAPSAGDLLFMEAWNKRLGTTGLRPAEMYWYSETQLKQPASLIPTIVEQDSWRYNTTRYGKPTVGRAMVCCVFVCNMWKAGGLFGDLASEINCGEQTNLDDYSLNIFNKTLMGDGRPEVCKKADPSNPLCQLVGPYTLNLNHYNEEPIYAHMAENCPSWNQGVGPDYWPQGKVNATC